MYFIQCTSLDKHAENGKNRSVSNKEYIFSPFPRGALKSLFELEIVYFFLPSAYLNWTYPKQVLSRKYLKYSNCTSLDWGLIAQSLLYYKRRLFTLITSICSKVKLLQLFFKKIFRNPNVYINVTALLYVISHK